jgi:hypothetical protein
MSQYVQLFSHRILLLSIRAAFSLVKLHGKLPSLPAAYKSRQPPRFRDAGRVFYLQKDASEHLGPASSATLCRRINMLRSSGPVMRHPNQRETGELPAQASAPNPADPERSRALHRLGFSIQVIVAHLRN